MDTDLDLREPAKLVEGASEDGTVLVHLIRPCVGRGRGRHLYEADMLERNASVFKGWKMYVDHRSEQAQRAAGGLPRSIRDLGGRILESWWDPNVPAEGRFGQGAVVGRCKPTPFVKALIDSDPELVESSINSTATGIRPVQHKGQRVNLVEGIAPRGSVDWVTEAGAGGKVVELMEATLVEEAGALEAMDDDDFVAFMAETRPGLMEALGRDETEGSVIEATDPEDAKDGGSDEMAECIAKYMKKGLPRKLAEKAAKRELAAQKVAESEQEDDEMAEITPAQVIEALRSDEGSTFLDALVEARVEAAIEEERDLIRAEARADADRQIELRDLRDVAQKAIREAKLPEALAGSMLKDFDLADGQPTPKLDVHPVYDEAGTRTKTARQVLTEAVEESIAEGRALLAELNPTEVEGVSGAKAEETGEKVEEAETGERKQPELVESLLTTAGFSKDVDPWAAR
jgi:hypothetical protein